MKKSNRNLFKRKAFWIAVIAVVLIAAAVTAVVLIMPSPFKTAKAAYQDYMNMDAEAWLDTYPDEVIQSLLEKYEIDRAFLVTNLTNMSRYDQTKRQESQRKETLKHISTEDMEPKALAKLKEKYADSYGITVEDAKIVTMQLIVESVNPETGKKYDDNQMLDRVVTVIKVDGEWCMQLANTLIPNPENFCAEVWEEPDGPTYQ